LLRITQLILRLSAAAAPLLLLAGCGYVGGPQTPLANVPAKVGDLAAVERGGVIIVHFSVPQLTTELHPIPKPVKLDLRIGPSPQPFQQDQWLAHAKSIPDVKVDQSVATAEIPVADWVGQETVLAVKVIGANGKDAGWSNYAIVKVVAAPQVPADFKVENTATGVHLTWAGPGDQFRIIRRTNTMEPWTVMMTATTHEWTDTSTEFGKPYIYEVQTLVNVGENKFAESELTAPMSITPIDVFPPAAPAGLRADVSPASIELVWDRNSEADLAGYRVYRATGDGPFEKIAETSEIPSYSDHAVEHGKTYRYAITAFDSSPKQNESQQSQPVTAVFQ